MYLAYPAQLPTAAADVPDAGVAIEMGGFVRLDGSTFRRQVVHYNKAGKVRQRLADHAVPTLCSCAPIVYRKDKFLAGRSEASAMLVSDPTKIWHRRTGMSLLPTSSCGPLIVQIDSVVYEEWNRPAS